MTTASRKNITDEQVIEACTRRLGDPSSLARLMEATGLPMKVCLAAMERAERRGLIEYGVSINYAWVR